MTDTVGFIGLGAMGSGMVRRLLSSGFDVLAFDLDEGRAARAVQHGAVVVDDARDLASRADVVCTSLPDPRSVTEVYRGRAGIIEVAGEGTFTIDFSTVDPQTSRDNARQGSERGLRVYDCPVSGGPREAAAGELVVFVGGEQDGMEVIGPILNCLGRIVHYIGPSGSGSTVKMVNNVIANGTVLLTAEAFVLGVKLGIEPRRLFDLLMSAGAKSHHFEKRFPKALADDFEPGYRLELARKDMALALDSGRVLKMPLPVTACMHELYTAGEALGLEGEDYVAIIKYFEQLAGTQARERLPE